MGPHLQVLLPIKHLVCSKNWKVIHPSKEVNKTKNRHILQRVHLLGGLMEQHSPMAHKVEQGLDQSLKEFTI
jgi:hypothetical protein